MTERGGDARDEATLPLILLVDDDDDQRELCGLTLRRFGFRTEEAGNGEITLERAFALRPDAILLDHSMPVMDGPETARHLRADERTRGTPIVMMTGFGAGTSAGRAAREGDCDGYLTKPCTTDDIVAALRGLLASGSRANLPWLKPGIRV